MKSLSVLLASQLPQLFLITTLDIIDSLLALYIYLAITLSITLTSEKAYPFSFIIFLNDASSNSPLLYLDKINLKYVTLSYFVGE